LSGNKLVLFPFQNSPYFEQDRSFLLCFSSQSSFYDIIWWSKINFSFSTFPAPIASF